MLGANAEWALWRHQTGERNPLSRNPLGIDPAGMFFKTEDHAVQIQKQGEDQEGRTIFYSQFEPVVGDLLVILAGKPPTADAAVYAPRVAFYTIVDFDVRRADTGRIIYTKILAVPNRSGQWSEYQNGDPMDPA